MADPVRALVTRPAEDAAETASRLEAMGVEPVIAPVTKIEPVVRGPLDLGGVQAVLATSRNGVRALARATDRRDVHLLAVGDATAALARSAGFRSVASAGGTAGDLAGLAAATLDPRSGRLVHAAGEAASGLLCRTLAAKGFDAAPEVLYRAVPIPLPAAAQRLLAERGVALALFFSAGAVHAFAGFLRAEERGCRCRPVAAICLSRQVADAAAALPWRAIRCAARPDLPAMLAAVAQALHDCRKPDRMNA